MSAPEIKRALISVSDKTGIVEFAKAGDTIKLGILRKNKEIELSVNLRKGI